MTRRVLAVAAAMVAAVAAAPWGLHPAGAVATIAVEAAAGPAKLTLLDQPIAVAPDGAFTVFVATEDAPTATRLAVDIYDRVAPGEAVGGQPEDGSAATFPPVELGDEVGGRRTGVFTIHPYPKGQDNPDPAWGYRITEPGVYPVRIRLWDSDGNTLATLITSMIRLPEADQTVPQTGAALLVPVHRPPPADPADRAKTDTADATLMAQLQPVLDQLAAHPSLPTTLSVTPDTAARIAGDPDAAAGLDKLRTELARDDRPLLDAPYVDIDAASLVSAGLTDTITLERDLGRPALQSILEPPVAGTWQLRGAVDAATLAQLRTRGIFRTILPEAALRGGAGVQAPVDLTAGEGTVRAVAVSAEYDLGLQAPDDPVLAGHRLLARLAAAGPGPTGTSGVVVDVDPATADPTSLQLVADALSFGTPFFTATTVPDLLDATPARGAVGLTSPKPAELGTYPADMSRAESSLTSYSAMVAGRVELIRPYELTLAISAADDLDLAQREHDARSVTASLHEPFTSISMPAKDKITLGAEVAHFPLPIESGLDYDVKVVVELESNDRIEFPNDRIERTLEPGKNEISIAVRTKAPGDTPVKITVRSPDGGVTLAESQYTIRSTAVSGVGIILTVGAALFLAVWWGRHWRRNRGTARELRHRRRERHEAVVAATGGLPPADLDLDADLDLVLPDEEADPSERSEPTGSAAPVVDDPSVDDPV